MQTHTHTDTLSTPPTLLPSFICLHSPSFSPGLVFPATTSLCRSGVCDRSSHERHTHTIKHRRTCIVKRIICGTLLALLILCILTALQSAKGVRDLYPLSALHPCITTPDMAKVTLQQNATDNLPRLSLWSVKIRTFSFLGPRCPRRHENMSSSSKS